MIKKIEIQNIKGIREIEIYGRPVNEISGQNGAGKTTILDSIAYAMAGRDEVDPEALRHGAESGFILLETEDMIIRREMDQEDRKGHLSIKAKAGGKLKQTDIDQLINTATFDPLRFARASGKEKIEIAKKILTADEQTIFKVLGEQIEKDEQERLLLGREIKAMGEPVQPSADEPADPAIEALREKEREILKENQRRKSSGAEAAGLRAQAEVVSINIENLKKERAKLEEMIQAAHSKIENIEMIEVPRLQAQKADLEAKAAVAQSGSLAPDLAAETEIRGQIQGAEIALAEKARWSEFRKKQAAIAEKKGTYEAWSQKINALRERRAEVVARALGEGFSYDHDGYQIRFNGVAFDSLSQAEKILASCKVVFKTDPKIRVVCIRDGSLLDDETLKLVVAECEKMGFQLWIETVGTGRSEDAIVISEGRRK